MKSKDDFIKNAKAFSVQLTGTPADAVDGLDDRIMTRRKDIHALMDEYAREVAIDFLKFAMDKYIRGDYDGDAYLSLESGKDEETVFDDYLKSKNNESKA